MQEQVQWVNFAFFAVRPPLQRCVCSIGYPPILLFLPSRRGTLQAIFQANGAVCVCVGRATEGEANCACVIRSAPAPHTGPALQLIPRQIMQKPTAYVRTCTKI